MKLKIAPERVCKFCNARFVPLVGNQIFCNNQHRELYYNKLPSNRYYEYKPTREKLCKNCGRSFLTNNRRKVYCSAECQLARKATVYKKIMPTDKVCPICSKTFTTSHAGKKYCSEKCRRRNRNEN